MTTPTAGNRPKIRPIRDELIYDTLMRLALATPDKGVRPEDVAMALRRDEWQALLPRVRIFAAKLAGEGFLDILRKGAPVDPGDFKGIYRIRATEKSADYTPRTPEA
jgi:hypothetical protein